MSTFTVTPVPTAPKRKPKRHHQSMNASDVTRAMIPHVDKADTWRPRNPTIPCADIALPDGCLPPYPTDRSPKTNHAHYAVPMLVPVAVSASITLDGIWVR